MPQIFDGEAEISTEISKNGLEKTRTFQKRAQIVSTNFIREVMAFWSIMKNLRKGIMYALPQDPEECAKFQAVFFCTHFLGCFGIFFNGDLGCFGIFFVRTFQAVLGFFLKTKKNKDVLLFTKNLLKSQGINEKKPRGQNKRRGISQQLQ